jgi:hypothetical protein
LDNAVDLNALEEAEQDGAEWEDDGKGREHDGRVCWSDLVTIAARIAISFGMRLRRKSSAAGDGSFIRRRLSHVREEGAVRIMALQICSLGRARYSAISRAPGVQKGLLLVGEVQLAIAVAEGSYILAVDVGRVVARVARLIDAVVIPPTIKQRALSVATVAGLNMIV